MKCITAACDNETDGLRCNSCLVDGNRRLNGTGSVERRAPLEVIAPSSGVAEREVSNEREIIAWLVVRGWDVTKTSIRTHPKGATKGTPDLYARHELRQRRVWIEVKKRDGAISQAQYEWHLRERAAGGEVIVAFCVKDLEQLEEKQA